MKVHKYQLEVYESIMDFTHEIGQTQTRLFVPGQGIIAYRDKEQIDFFSEDEKSIAEAERIARGEEVEKSKYLGRDRFA